MFFLFILKAQIRWLPPSLIPLITPLWLKYAVDEQTIHFSIEFGHQKEYPELTFNMVVERKFFYVVMKYLVPLFAVLALLFAIVMMTNADQDVIGLYDMKALKALRSCASLFFLVLVGHIHLRQLLANTPVVYLEYFYIMAYLIIVLVSLNVYLYTVKWPLEPNAIREKNALLAQLLFWPLVLGGYLGVTFVAFL